MGVLTSLIKLIIKAGKYSTVTGKVPAGARVIRTYSNKDAAKVALNAARTRQARRNSTGSAKLDRIRKTARLTEKGAVIGGVPIGAAAAAALLNKSKKKKK